MIRGKVKSDKGFYVGDVCYVLSDEVYHNVWGEKNKYKAGLIDVPDSDYWFAVAGTAYGDGTYYDSHGHDYPVDAGVIGLVPLELVAKESGTDFGMVVEGAGIASFEADDGMFTIGLPSVGYFSNDTRYDDWC